MKQQRSAAEPGPGSGAAEAPSLTSAQPLRQRLGEQVASLLLTAIRLYEFLPDERLPPEAELCAQLGVNRMAVREGLRWLEDHQYIEIKRGRFGGAYVVQPALDVAVERLRGMAVNFRHLFEYRAAVEPLAAELAAERIGPTELARLNRLHELELQKPPIGRHRFRAIDVSVHQLVASACRNDYLIVAVRDIRAWMAPALDLLDSSVVRRQESLDSHGRLIRCLHEHDRAGAGEAMRAHIAVTERAVAAVLSAQGVPADTLPG
ncbi:MAG TPA: FCD domain-containing protein [Streptosporangiaceae bacterium]|nr:FCD domain-containing protein [Streptosporangiaceae bacterium]